MKRVFTLLIILIGLHGSNLHAQDYGFLKQQNEWIVHIVTSHIESIYQSYNNSFYVFDDSTYEINNTNYKLLQLKKSLEQTSWPKVRENGFDYRGTIDTSIKNIAYFREDSNKYIYCKMIASGSYGIPFNNSEFLFMRPDLGIGDTLIYTAAMPPETLIVRDRLYEVFLNDSTQTNDSVLNYTFDVVKKNLQARFSYLYGYEQSGPLFSYHDQFENPVAALICFWNGYYEGNGFAHLDKECINSPSLIPRSSLNVEKVKEVNLMQIHPNPVLDKLYIKNTDGFSNRFVQANVLDLSGRIVQRHLLNEELFIETHHLVAGMYLLEIVDANGRKGYEKFVKE